MSHLFLSSTDQLTMSLLCAGTRQNRIPDPTGFTGQQERETRKKQFKYDEYHED